MRARLVPATILLTLALVDPALAHDNGEGLVGETDDKIVTFFGLAVALFFVVVATVGTLIQQALEKRKEERKAARLRQRTGW
jgi:hypothetical protein